MLDVNVELNPGFASEKQVSARRRIFSPAN
jgi:hypothetical protein